MIDSTKLQEQNANYHLKRWYLCDCVVIWMRNSSKSRAGIGVETSRFCQRSSTVFRFEEAICNALTYHKYCSQQQYNTTIQIHDSIL